MRLETGKLEADYSIPMVLFCPNGHRHIDAGEFAEAPHHTHACQECGIVWRPAKVNTHGVQFLPGYRNELEKLAWGSAAEERDATGEPLDEGEYVAIPRAAWEFLEGTHPIEGRFFIDSHPTRKGRFWWRSLIRSWLRPVPE